MSMFGLCVRFTCKDETSAEFYDRLVAETIEAIKADEPGTLVYASHLVDGQPLQRIFYELYRDEDAFHAHEAAPHTRRYRAGSAALRAGSRGARGRRGDRGTTRSVWAAPGAVRRLRAASHAGWPP